MEVFRAPDVNEEDYRRIVEHVRSGRVVVFPTDTAYGLGADPFNEAAIREIFRLKGRAEDKPILLAVDSMAMVLQAARPNEAFYQLVHKFWPGPLTIILPAADNLPKLVTAGSGTVGIRWPKAQFATTLIRLFGKPLTATSANRSSMPAAITMEEVRDQFGDSISLAIDGGRLPARTGSTLIDLTQDPPVLLREGSISFHSLHDFFEGRIRRQTA